MTNPISNLNLKSVCRKVRCLLLLAFLVSLLLEVFAEGKQTASTNFMGLFLVLFRVNPIKT